MSLASLRVGLCVFARLRGLPDASLLQAIPSLSHHELAMRGRSREKLTPGRWLERAYTSDMHTSGEMPAESPVLDVLLTERQLALRWQVSARTLRNQRWLGTGCVFIRIGRLVRYRLGDIVAMERTGTRR